MRCTLIAMAIFLSAGMLFAQDAQTVGVTPEEAKEGFLRVTLNGTVITDADLGKIEKTIDGHDHPGLHNAKGYISWLGHGNPPDPVEFRDIRLKELP
jgi:hypothetical protein